MAENQTEQEQEVKLAKDPPDLEDDGYTTEDSVDDREQESATETEDEYASVSGEKEEKEHGKERIDMLSVPQKRLVKGVLTECENVLTPDMKERLLNILKEDYGYPEKKLKELHCKKKKYIGLKESAKLARMNFKRNKWLKLFIEHVYYSIAIFGQVDEDFIRTPEVIYLGEVLLMSVNGNLTVPECSKMKSQQIKIWRQLAEKIAYLLLSFSSLSDSVDIEKERERQKLEEEAKLWEKYLQEIEDVDEKKIVKKEVEEKDKKQVQYEKKDKGLSIKEKDRIEETDAKISEDVAVSEKPKKITENIMQKIDKHEEVDTEKVEEKEEKDEEKKEKEKEEADDKESDKKDKKKEDKDKEDKDKDKGKDRDDSKKEDREDSDEKDKDKDMEKEYEGKTDDKSDFKKEDGEGNAGEDDKDESKKSETEVVEEDVKLEKLQKENVGSSPSSVTDEEDTNIKVGEGEGEGEGEKTSAIELPTEPKEIEKTQVEHIKYEGQINDLGEELKDPLKKSLGDSELLPPMTDPTYLVKDLEGTFHVEKLIICHDPLGLKSITIGELLHQVLCHIENDPCATPERQALARNLIAKLGELISSDNQAKDITVAQLIATVTNGIAAWLEQRMSKSQKKMINDHKVLEEFKLEGYVNSNDISENYINQVLPFILEALTLAEEWGTWISETAREAKAKEIQKHQDTIMYKKWEEEKENQAMDFSLRKKQIIQSVQKKF